MMQATPSRLAPTAFLTTAFLTTVVLTATLLAAAPAQAQDAAAGERKAASCIGCHGIVGYQASFPQVYKVPMISGQNAAYIVASLTAYKKGERKHPTMRSIAGSLTDADMADLGAYYEQHGQSSVKSVAATTGPATSPAVAALLTKGACASCHGADFNKPISPAYPKLAGQYAALLSYSVEGNPHVGRANAIMGAQVKQFQRAELKAMAEHLAKLPGDLKVVPQSRFR
jgi:cytochrome c553